VPNTQGRACVYLEVSLELTRLPRLRAEYIGEGVCTLR